MSENEPKTESVPASGVNSESIMRRAATGRWPSLREGFFTPWDGLRFMFRYPGLWKYGIMPIVLNVLITGVVLLLLVTVAIYAVNTLHPKFPDAWYGLALEIVCCIGLFLLALVGAFIAWLLMQSILCGYFYGKLAVQVELQLGMKPEEIHEVSLGYQIADAVRDVTLLAIINIRLLVLHIVPLIGSIAATIGSLYFDFLILGSDFLNHPLDLRGLRRAEKRAFTRRFRYHTLGLGAAVMLMMMLPFIGAVFLTTAVTGSVLLHRRLTGDNPTMPSET